MTMDNDTKVNPDTETKDSDTSVDTETNDTSEDNTSDAKYENQKKRAEKAEAKAKEAEDAKAELEQALKDALKTKDEQQSVTKVADAPLSREETILIAKGFDETLLQEAKDIAKGKDIGLLEAIETDGFKLIEEKYKTDIANQQAQLGASSGSAPHTEKSFTSGMEDKDHKALFEEKLGIN